MASDKKIDRSVQSISKAFSDATSAGQNLKPADIGDLIVAMTIGFFLVVGLITVLRTRRSKEDKTQRLVFAAIALTISFVILLAYIAITTVRVA